MSPVGWKYSEMRWWLPPIRRNGCGKWEQGWKTTAEEAYLQTASTALSHRMSSGCSKKRLLLTESTKHLLMPTSEALQDFAEEKFSISLFLSVLFYMLLKNQRKYLNDFRLYFGYIVNNIIYFRYRKIQVESELFYH